MLISTLVFAAATALTTTVAQAPAAPYVLNNGPCLDSPRSVPQSLQAPAVRATQIVKIDMVVSTSTMTVGETIGFLYTLEDGTTWLGQRTVQYVSPAGAQQINQLLASTHLPSSTVTSFPPQTRLGVKTNYLQYFQIKLPAQALDPLGIHLTPCVAWPSTRPLPDPTV
ncbi:MAG: hypothetical protein M3R30_07775 [Candidatus Eremiobacteraeota bacterium]|nr:hypothetical protein [Candidatus Eremiobacteraeota bacterium]